MFGLAPDPIAQAVDATAAIKDGGLLEPCVKQLAVLAGLAFVGAGILAMTTGSTKKGKAMASIEPAPTMTIRTPIVAKSGSKYKMEPLGDGSLRVEGRENVSFFEFADADQAWDVVLPTDPDLDLEVDANAASSTLDLDDATLTSLSIDANAGEVVMRLRSPAWADGDISHRPHARTGRRTSQCLALVGDAGQGPHNRFACTWPVVRRDESRLGAGAVPAERGDPARGWLRIQTTARRVSNPLAPGPRSG